MRPPTSRQIEERLIAEVLGWSVVEAADEVGSGPAAYWSSREGCFRVVRGEESPAERFSPTRCFRDAWEVRERLGNPEFVTVPSRPLDPRHVRLVADFGRREVVVEGRSLPHLLSLAIYQALEGGLL